MDIKSDFTVELLSIPIKACSEKLDEAMDHMQKDFTGPCKECQQKLVFVQKVLHELLRDN